MQGDYVNSPAEVYARCKKVVTVLKRLTGKNPHPILAHFIESTEREIQRWEEAERTAAAAVGKKDTAISGVVPVLCVATPADTSENEPPKSDAPKPPPKTP